MFLRGSAVKNEKAANQNGELFLSYYYGNTIMYSDQFETEFENNSYSKLYFIRKGRCEFVIKGISSIEAGEGDFLLIPAGTVHRRNYIRGDGDKQITLSWCHFDLTKKDQDYFHDELDLYYKISLSEIMQRKVGRYFDAMFSLAKKDDPTSRIGVLANLMNLIALYVKRAARNQRKLPDTHEKKIIEFIHKNISQPIKTKDLAKYLFLSENYLIRYFKEKTGMTPQQYILKCKMEFAKGMLENTFVPIAEIMEKIGFYDLCYFSRCFKKFSGFSPQQYRNHYGKSKQRSEGFVIEE